MYSVSISGFYWCSCVRLSLILLGLVGRITPWWLVTMVLFQSKWIVINIVLFPTSSSPHMTFCTDQLTPTMILIVWTQSCHWLLLGFPCWPYVVVDWLDLTIYVHWRQIWLVGTSCCWLECYGTIDCINVLLMSPWCVHLLCHCW